MYELLSQTPIFAFGCIGIKALKSSSCSSRKKEEERLKKERVKARWRKKPSEKKKKDLSYLQALLAWHWCWSRQHCWWLCTRKWLRLCVCAVAGSAVRSPSHHQTQSPGRAGAKQKARNVIFRGLLFFSEGITLLQYINNIYLDLQITHCLAFVFSDLKESISSSQFIQPIFMSCYKLVFSMIWVCYFPFESSSRSNLKTIEKQLLCFDWMV